MTRHGTNVVLIGRDNCGDIQRWTRGTVNSVEEDKEAREYTLPCLIREYEDLFEDQTKVARIPPVRIEIRGNPRSIRTPRPCSVSQKETIEKAVTEMLENGIIEESNSSFASPLVLVKKKDGEVRFCVDYRELNKSMVDCRYPLPRINELLRCLKGVKYFSCLDLRAGYWQVEITEDSKEWTAFVCHKGVFHFKVLPFGLKIAPAMFQKNMENLLGRLLYNGVLVYMDDIIIYSITMEEHVNSLRKVFEILRAANISVKRAKCRFGVLSLDYLGHVVSAEGIQPQARKIQAIREWPEPGTRRQIRGFLGAIGYYRYFIKDLAK